MSSTMMYCQMSSSVQFDSGNTRMLSPLFTRVFVDAPEFGALVLGSRRGWRAEREDAFLGAGLFLVAAGSTERASKPYWSSACFRPSVFITWVCSAEPESNGLIPRRTPVLVDVNDHLEAQNAPPWSRNAIICEFPRGVDVHQRKRRQAR